MTRLGVAFAFVLLLSAGPAGATVPHDDFAGTFTAPFICDNFDVRRSTQHVFISVSLSINEIVIASDSAFNQVIYTLTITDVYQTTNNGFAFSAKDEGGETLVSVFGTYRTNASGNIVNLSGTVTFNDEGCIGGGTFKTGKKLP